MRYSILTTVLLDTTAQHTDWGLPGATQHGTYARATRVTEFRSFVGGL